VLEVAFVVPLDGPAGMFGPSCEACGLLAKEEINAAGGINPQYKPGDALAPEEAEKAVTAAAEFPRLLLSKSE